MWINRGGFLSVWYYWYDPTARSYCNTMHLQRSTVVAPLLLASGLEPFYFVVKACCDMGMTCLNVYQRVWLAPRTTCPVLSFLDQLSSLSHIASLLILYKYMEILLLRLLMWTWAKSYIANIVVDHSDGHLSLTSWEQSWLWCLCM